MFDILYSFIFSPSKTIQTKSHTKDWRLWWSIIGVTALISVIQVTKIGLFPILFHGVFYVAWLCVVGMIIDAAAQLMGSRSQLRTIIYWFGFANTIFWLSPSIVMIQPVFSSISALAMLILNGFFLFYIWTILKLTYQFSNLKVLGLFFIPIISAIVTVIAMIIYSSHWISALL